MVDIITKKFACPVLKGVYIDHVSLNGTESVTVAGSASSTVTITHDAMGIAGAPDVSIDNTNLSIKIENVTDKSFDVVVTNSSTASQTGTITWKRQGLNITVKNEP